MVCCCMHRFTSVLEMLLELREQLQKDKLSAPVEECKKAVYSLCIKLLKK